MLLGFWRIREMCVRCMKNERRVEGSRAYSLGHSVAGLPLLESALGGSLEGSSFYISRSESHSLRTRFAMRDTRRDAANDNAAIARR
jgi:hypothetical protein